MPETQPELSLPPKLSDAEKARINQRGRALWPDLRPETEQNQSDITQITRDIARGS